MHEYADEWEEVFRWLPLAERRAARGVCRGWRAILDVGTAWPEMLDAAMRAAALRTACRREHLHAGRWLARTLRLTPADAGAVEEGRDLNALRRPGETTALQTACGWGRPEAVTWLAREFALGARDARVHANQALCDACEFGHREAALRLITTFQLTRDDVLTEDTLAFRAACGGSHLDVMMMLADTFELTRGDISHYLCEALNDVCAAGDLPAARWLSRRFGVGKADARVSDEFGVPGPLQLACAKGHEDVAGWLVGDEFGLDVADARAGGNYALWAACMHGHRGVVKFLVSELGLTVADVRDAGCRAFVVACEFGWLEIAQDLAALGLTVDDVRVDGNVALRLAIVNGHNGVERWLREAYGMRERRRAEGYAA